MTNQSTVNKMMSMRLLGMKQAFEAATQSAATYTNDELVAHLIDAESLYRDNLKMNRLLKNAHFRQAATISDIDFQAPRGLDKNLLLRLAQTTFITQKQNIIITAPTGAGKTFIACAIGHQACTQGFRVAYFNTRKLFHLLHQALADNTYLKWMTKIQKFDLIILDDFGLQALDAKDRQALLEIIEDRHQHKSTIIASQIPASKWHDIIKNSAVADAILDRIVHAAHRIELKGESMRKKAKINSLI